MINIHQEQLVPINDAPRHAPGRPHISTIWRWINRPEKPLETIKCGGRRYTSCEAIARFCVGAARTDDPKATIDQQLDAAGL